MKKVSIIVPMYNVSKYLETCIGSVSNQKMADADLEVIMVDDGSPDDSRSVADQLAKEHKFISVISQENKGLGGARNTGIKNAKGEYIIFLDADDILMPDTLQHLIEIAEDHSLDILEFSAQKTNEQGFKLEEVVSSSKGLVYNGIDYYTKFKFMNSACNKMYSRKFIKVHNLLFSENIYAEDFEFNTRVFFVAQRIMAVAVVAASFLQSSNSITRNNNPAIKNKYIKDFILILTKIRDYEQMLGNITLKQKNYFDQRIADRNAGLFYFMFKNRFSYKKMRQVKSELTEKELFCVNIPFNDRKRDIFRKIMLQHFFLFRLSQPLKRLWK